MEPDIESIYREQTKKDASYENNTGTVYCFDYINWLEDLAIKQIQLANAPPELLSACQRALLYLAQDHTAMGRIVIDELRMAIPKATDE